MSKHRWSGRTTIGLGANLKNRHRCTRCGWERWTFLPPHHGGNGIQYRRGDERIGGRGKSAAPPPCEEMK